MSRYRLHTSYLGHERLVVLYAYLSDESFKVLDTDFDGVYLNANNAIESLEKRERIGRSNLPFCPGSCDKVDLNLTRYACRCVL